MELKGKRLMDTRLDKHKDRTAILHSQACFLNVWDGVQQTQGFKFINVEVKSFLSVGHHLYSL